MVKCSPATNVINKGETGHASLLHIPMILIRLAALSIGPSMVMYGLMAVCRNALAVPQQNEATMKRTKLSCFAEKMRMPKEMANIKKATAIVRL